MLDFYCNVLGCAVERRRDDIGLIQLRAGRSMIDLVPVDGELGRTGGAPPGPDGRNLDHLCFRLETFDEPAIRQQLAAAGIRDPPDRIALRRRGSGAVDLRHRSGRQHGRAQGTAVAAASRSPLASIYCYSQV